MKPTYTAAMGAVRATGTRLCSKRPAAAIAAMPSAVNSACRHVSVMAKLNLWVYSTILLATTIITTAARHRGGCRQGQGGVQRVMSPKAAGPSNSAVASLLPSSPDDRLVTPYTLVRTQCGWAPLVDGGSAACRAAAAK